MRIHEIKYEDLHVQTLVLALQKDHDQTRKTNAIVCIYKLSHMNP
jgi:hypothetical protein